MERAELRCVTCGKLLGKGKAVDLSIKCPRCKTINHITGGADKPPQTVER
jgi:phage FluMu protein Com